MTKSTGAVFREGIEINKSLFTLRQVISSLYEISQGDSSNKHIPYRDSKLTSLLKQSIGGNTYCSMVNIRLYIDCVFESYFAAF